jgi:flagellin-like hook-associated protein FlgL
MLGLSAGASSTGQNSLVFSTDEGSFTVNLAEGTHSAGDVVSAINNVKPGSASVDGGRISLSAGGGQSFVAMGSGSANSVLGMSAGTTRSTDNFRYRVNYGGWQSIDLPEGQMSASDLSDVINARTPGIASVVGGRVRLRSDSGAAQIHIGSGTANGLLGVTTNQEENGENLLSLRVNGVTRSTTLGAGTYSSSEIADAYNGLFSGVASVVGGKVKLSVSGPGASINSGSSALNGALGIPDGALAEANNILKFRVDGGGMETVALSAGTFTASQLVDQINAVIPGLAQTSGGNVVVSSSGSNASIAVGNGSANGVVGLSNGQSVSTPTQGKDLVFSVNGESTTVHFDPGSYTPQDVINQINSSRPGFATVLGDGRIRLATQSVGNVNTVSIGSGSINGTLGISAGQSATGVDTDSLALTSLQSPEAAGQAIERATQAIEELALAGADIGAFLNKSDVVSEGLRTELATSEAARSRIEDVDIAREATAIAKADITSNTAASLMSAIAVMERSVAELFTLVQKP